MNDAPPPLSDALRHPDPAARADALRKVRFRDLKDRATLAAVLEAAGDPTPIDAPGAVKDPFAAFFREGPTSATVADLAAERIEKAGLPEDRAAAELLAEVLGQVGGPLPALAAKLLGDTRWEDPDHAVRVLVPAIADHDAPLFQVLVKLPSSVRDTLCALAATPFRPRLFQELLNHPPTQDAAVTAVTAAVTADPSALDEAGAIGLVSTLTAWNRAEARTVARALLPRFPALLAWLALDEEPARGELATRLAEGALGDVARFWPRIAEVLKHREPIPGWPVAPFLAETGVEAGVVAAWGVGDAVAPVLEGWIAALAEPEPPPERVDRAWAAARHLAAAGRLDPASRGILEGALAGEPDRWPAFEEPTLGALADAGLAGLGEALARGVALDPGALADVVPAARRVGAGRLVLEVALGLAEGAPRVVERLSAGVVKDRPAAIDVDAAEPLVTELADPDLTARFERVRAVVRAG